MTIVPTTRFPASRKGSLWLVSRHPVPCATNQVRWFCIFFATGRLGDDTSCREGEDGAMSMMEGEEGERADGDYAKGEWRRRHKNSKIVSFNLFR